MEIQDAIRLLEHHNKWRRGADIPMVNPTVLGEAIDEIIKEFKEKMMEKEKFLKLVEEYKAKREKER